MNEQQIVEQTITYFKEQFSGESTGHDWHHLRRVWSLAKSIAEAEGNMDLFVVEMGALLHDISDHKFNGGDETLGGKEAEKFLRQFDIAEDRIFKIVQIVQEISFKGMSVRTPMSSLEGAVVQDADRLDAIGAIGIARTFAYGGAKGRPIYDPLIKPVCHTSFAAYKTSSAPTLNHFYEKLLHLKDRLNTATAHKEAIRRQDFMEDFLKQFYRDWDAQIED
jgi:uncharacterized protein